MMLETKRGRRADNDDFVGRGHQVPATSGNDDIAIPSDVHARGRRRDLELERAFARRRRELEALFAA